MSTTTGARLFALHAKHVFLGKRFYRIFSSPSRISSYRDISLTPLERFRLFGRYSRALMTADEDGFVPTVRPRQNTCPHMLQRRIERAMILAVAMTRTDKSI